MSKNLLTEATRALRETEEASELEARSTRARVMSGLHQTRVRYRTRVVFLLPIAASFVALSAWGSSNGNARRAIAAAVRWVSPDRAPAPNTNTNTNAKPRVRAPASAPWSAAPSAPRLPTLPELATPAPVPELAAAAPSPRAPASSRSASARPEPTDPALALYRVAHAAHFVDHDAQRALAGWDAYLAAAPHGAFAPEARYNRALSLVRLGRNSEARSALEPFANGSHGGYREAEANALLQRLSE